MLVVTAEIWPDGDESKSHEIGYIFASNEADIDGASAYEARILQNCSEHLSTAAIDRYVLAFRERSDDVWGLVAEILNSAGITAGHGINPIVAQQLQSALAENKKGNEDA